MIELKPCPFCGGESNFIGETATIKCKNCGGAFLVTSPLKSRYEVARAWNTRKSQKKQFDDTCPVCGVGKAEGEISTIPCFESKFGSKEVYRLVCNHCGRKTMPCETIEESERRWMEEE